MKQKIIKKVESHVVNVFGKGNKQGGWGPAGPNANPLNCSNVTFSFFIEENENGYLLSCISENKEMYDDWQFESIEAAEDTASEIYGITSEQWSI